MYQGKESGPPLFSVAFLFNSQQKCSQNQTTWSQIPARTCPSGRMSAVHGGQTGAMVTVPSTGCPYFLFVIKKQKPPKCPRMSLQHFWHAQAQKVLHIPGSCLLTEDLQPDLLKKIGLVMVKGIR